VISCREVTGIQLIPDLIVTFHGNSAQLWSNSGECITSFAFTKPITASLFDAQYKNLVLFHDGEVNIISIDRLDVYETYNGNLNIVSALYGVYDNMPIRFALGADGLLYTYE